MNLFMTVLEIIGTAAFAVSGAMTGIKKGMDLFGVVILGLLTAVGGGALRDVLLGLTPPAMLTDPMYTIISICVSIASFVLLTDRLVMNHRLLLDRILLVTDSLGLGSFTVYGVSVALRASDGGLFLVVFLGVITGVGGGVLRDALAGDMPYIFTKHIYACASIVGALACALLWDVMGSTAAMLIGLVLIVVIRFLAAYFRWDLPRAKISDTNTKS